MIKSMNILIVSESFVIREYMEIFLKDLLKNSNIKVKNKLSEATKDELLQTDFILIEIYNEIANDLKIIDYIKMKNKNLKTLVMDKNKNKNTFKKVINYGIEGYLTNYIEKDEFIFLIKKVLSGKKYYETDLIEVIVNSKNENNTEKLTKREYEVLEEMSKALNNKEIGENLFISEGTVKKHISNIFQKLNLRNRQEAIIYINNKK